MLYKLTNIPDGCEVIGFSIERGVGWRLAYWAWVLFKVQLPMGGKRFVVKLKQ